MHFFSIGIPEHGVMFASLISLTTQVARNNKLLILKVDIGADNLRLWPSSPTDLNLSTSNFYYNIDDEICIK